MYSVTSHLSNIFLIINILQLLIYVSVNSLGCITPFRSVQMFCAYTMVGVVFCYFYQLTFTLACMAYDGRREERQRHCVTFKEVTPQDQAGE